MPPAAPQPIRYRDDLEQPSAEENETIDKIVELMATAMHNVRKNVGESVRPSHAKAHAFLRGELVIESGLPSELAQGLFATPGTHPVIARLATAPGEMLDDEKVPTQRGFAFKVFDVAGEMLPGHAGQTTQDFVLENEKAFLAGGVKEFLVAFTPNATLAPKLSDTTKGVVSKLAKVANDALETVGLKSGKLDIYGHPPHHPLAEAYYSQTPYRWGDYVAKFGIVPANLALKELFEKEIDVVGENGLRQLMIDYFNRHGAEFVVAAQLMVDEKRQPIENASVEWPEDLSPYRPVARLTFPPQNAFDPTTQDFVDHKVTFSPAHSLAAHRPLGGINRARLKVYPLIQEMRHAENRQPSIEPTRPGDVPSSA